MAGNTVPANVVIRINDRDVTNSFNAINKEVKRLERELKNTVRGTEEFDKKLAELEEAKKHLEAVKKEIKSTNDELNGFKGIFAGNVAADFFEGGIAKIQELGQALKERVEQLAEIKTMLSTLDPGLQGGFLDKAAVSVQSIADTYGKGIEEIRDAVKALNAQTHDSNKSLDLIKKGFLAGADASGEMLTQLREYPTMMNDARVSAEEMIAIMSNAEKMGVYDDKGIDAIKEGMLKIREGTKSTQDAMKALGIDVDDTYSKIKSGSLTYFDVLKMVSDRLKKVGADSRITGTAIADIFGGPGEDAGYKYLSQLGSIKTNLNDLIKTTDKTVIAKNKELEANEKLNSVWIKLTSTAGVLNRAYTSIKSGLADTLSFVFRIKEAKLSDEYLKQENRLRYLKSQLDITNLSEQKKLDIFQSLKTEFPQYFKGLDLEKMKHDEITKAINRSIDALGRKYKAQVFQEKFDESSTDYQEKLSDALDYEKKGIELIGQALKKVPELKDFKFKSQTTVNQLRELDSVLQKVFESKKGDGSIFDERSWQSFDTSLQRSIHATSISLANANKAALAADMKRIADQKVLTEMQSKLIPDVFVTEDPAPGANQDANLAVTPKKDTTESDIEKARAAYDKAKDDYTKTQKSILDSTKQLQDERLKIIEESRLKETQIEDQDYYRKLDSLKQNNQEILNEISKAESEIKKLQNEKKSVESPVAKKLLQDAIDKENETIVEKNKLIKKNDDIALQYKSTYYYNLAKISEKWDGEFIKRQIELEDLRINEQRRKDEDEITKISDLTEAKLKLKKLEYLKLTDQELIDLNNLEDAKTALREEADRKMLAAQTESLSRQKAILEYYIKSLSDGPAKEKLLKDLEELKNKISGVKSAIQGGSDADSKKVTEENDAAKEKLDVLGYSAKDWEKAWDNLDTTEGKIKAVGMVVSALGNAFAQFSQLQTVLNQKELNNFTKVQNGKKKALLKQLNEGLINQEEYHKALEVLEVEKANKEAEMSYKQAKIQKAVQIATAISQTALGVVSALAMNPWTPANYVLAGLVGALGAVQIGVIANTPLPDKPSFDQGGFTGAGFGLPDASGFKPAGVVHEGEWVAPEWMVNDPKIANVIGYLESVRTGRNKAFAAGGFSVPEDNTSSSSNNSPATSAEGNPQYFALFSEVKDLLEYLKENGVEAWMIEDAENGKRIKRTIKKFEKIENNAAGK